MDTIRWPRASSSLLALALFASAGGAQDEKEKPEAPAAEVPMLRVPAAAAPVIDGLVADAEWAGGVPFTVGVGDQTFARGALLRAGRQLYLSLRSDQVPAWATSFHLHFIEPVTKRRTTVRISPALPPQPPLGAFRRQGGRQPELLSAAAGDLRLSLREQGFDCEVRLPLDFLEISRSDKGYEFHCELWNLAAQRAVASFPVTAAGPRLDPRVARLLPVGDWGAKEPLEREKAAPQPALRLLERITTEDRWRSGDRTGDAPETVLAGHLGMGDGKRREGPLAQLEKTLVELVAKYPDYLSLHANLVRVRRGRNGFAAALETVRGMEKTFPFLADKPRQVLVRAQLLRDQGRYEDALALIDASREALRNEPRAAGERFLLEGLRDSLALETKMRAQDAAANLPRAILETPKGKITLELLEDDAPNAVANFVSLVEAGTYVGTRFHWVESGGRVIGGDPNSKNDDPHDDGFGDAGYLIESEPSRRQHLAYMVAFADKRSTRRTEGCAFVIHITPIVELDGISTVFGRILEGHDVVRRLEHYDTITKATITQKRNHPYTPVKR